MSITTTQLCLLADISTDRFESMLRRDKLDRFFDPDRDTGKWARYNFADLLNLAAVVLLEQSGLRFEAAVEVVSNNAAGSAYAAHRAEAPLIIAAYLLDASDPSRGHLCGTRDEVLARIPGEAVAVHFLDLSALAEALVTRAVRNGFSIEGNTILRARRE